MKKGIQINWLVLLALLVSGCGTPPPVVETGPFVKAEAGPVELEVGVDINSNGDVVLNGDFSLATLGPIGVGWHVGVEKVLYEASQETAALFILWEDTTGEIWREKYRIGQPFRVTFNDQQRVREIRSEGDNMIVSVEPIGAPPDYDDLQDDIKYLVERWDTAHYNADRHWDTSSLDSVLEGEALQEQRETVEWLQSNNCYWEIQELMTPEIIFLEFTDSRSLIVHVRKNWDMDLYCNDKKADDDDGYFTVKYNIDNINDKWYITRKQIIERS
jgi:hypothetical protein